MPSRILRLWNPSASAWEEVGDSRLTAHLAAADPHPGYLLESLVDAKGDLLGASANDTPARLAVGADGQVLTADSTQTLGLRWAAAAGGGAVTSVDGQTGAVTLGPTYVNVTGDAMTGTLSAPVVVAGTGAATVSRVYGASSGTLTPAAQTGNLELGVRFRSTAAGTLGQVRWYRTAAGSTTPSQVRLWDTTATGTPAYTVPGGDLTPFADTAVGWKTAALSSPPTLVAGRDYVLSYATGSAYGQADPYTPVPDSPVVFVNHVFTFSVGTYPSSTHTAAFLIDPGVAMGAGGAAAAAGAVRLPNAAAVAWRNAGNTADLALTVDGSNQLTFNGSAIGAGAYLPLAGGTLTGDLALSEATPTVSLKLAADTQPRSRLSDTALAFGPGGTTAPDTTLQRTGVGALRADTNLGVGANPAAWGSTLRGFQVGSVGGLTAPASGAGGVFLTGNTYFDGAAWKALVAGAGGYLQFSADSLLYFNAPSVAAGASQTLTQRLGVGATGTLTVTPDAGVAAVSLGAATGIVTTTGDLRLDAAAGAHGVQLATGGTPHVSLYPPSSALYPINDGGLNLGLTTNRWGTVYAFVGTINTSLADAKTAITPLDPTAAMTAVRNTTPCTFDYLPPERSAEWYELPEDPEQAEAVLYQRLVSGPLEEAARHQQGVVLNDPSHPCDPLFATGEGQTNPSNTCGILLAALKSIDQRLTALGG